MSQFYGYRCYGSDGIAWGWFYTANSGQEYNWTVHSSQLSWCKRWKTARGAERSFDRCNKEWNFRNKGGYLKIEIMPDFEIPLSRAALSRKEWDAANSDVIKQSKAVYDQKRPVVSFRPTSEIREWLDEERWNDGVPETDAALINRKLEKLRKLECQGY